MRLLPSSTVAARMLAGFALLLASCATPGELEPGHAPSALATPLPEADFAAYVAAAGATIAAAQRQLGREPTPEQVALRAPFELLPAGSCPRGEAGHARGALLIHSLGGTPYEMRALGARLAAACYLVRAILLPGHGTVPGDLREVGAEDWREATRRGAADLAELTDEVFLVGFGEGGALALEHTLADPSGGGNGVRGLVLLAPTLAPPAGLAAFARRHLGAGALASSQPFVALLPEDDPARYNSIALNAERQATALLERLHAHSSPLTVPVFMALTEEDAASDAAAARRWFCRRPIGPRRLLWYAGSPEPVEDCRFVEPRASAAPPAVLDLAHQALPIAPDDPHYGAAGDYLDCRHYYHETDTPNWLLCLDPSKTPANSAIRYGEITRPNLAAHVMRRLTYNPDFEALVAEILTFLDELPWRDPPVPRPKPAA